MDAGVVGQVVLELGGGRAKANDSIDYAVGCDHIAKVGTEVNAGDELLRVHARSQAALETALVQIRRAVDIKGS